jgi:hypothetical protein
MFGKATGLTARETRKQQLLVESELNRARLLNELCELKDEVRHLKLQAQAVGSMAFVAAKLATTFSAIGSAFSHRDNDDTKPSWISALLKGAQTCASLWEEWKAARQRDAAPN